MRIGDKVVCIDDSNLYRIPVKSICEGIVYTLSDVFQCRCGNVYVRLSEVNKFYTMWCPRCDVFETTIMYFHVQRFRRLDEMTDAEEGDMVVREPAPDAVTESA